MSDARLAEIEQALTDATPGPWVVTKWHDRTVMPSGWADDVLAPADRGPFMAAGCSEVADAHLIANAPAWLASLLAEVKRFRAPVTAPARCGVDLGTKPYWMGVDQYDPCPCLLPNGHDGAHVCEHTNMDSES